MPSKSKSQQRFFGIVRGIQKGSSKGSKTAKDVAGRMNPDDVEDYAKTKHSGLPYKVRKEMKTKFIKQLESLIRREARKEINESFATGNRKIRTQQAKRNSEVLGYKMVGEVEAPSWDLTKRKDRG